MVKKAGHFARQSKLLSVTVTAFIVTIAQCADRRDPTAVDTITKTSALMQPTGWFDTVPSLVRFSNLGIASTWENSSVAIPPNAASCGANGAVILTRGDSWNGALVSKNSLTCAQAGTNCAATSVDLGAVHASKIPMGMDDRMTETSDADITRLPNGHILVARMIVRYSPSKPSNRRGMVAFYDSADCGVSFTELSQLDPLNPSIALHDFDMGRIFADPWSSRIFYVVQDSSGVSAVFISTNGGSTWAAHHDLQWGFGAYRVTTFRSGRAYFFGTYSTTGNLYQFDPVSGWSSAMTVATDDWDAGPGATDNHGLTRVGAFPDGDYVRVLHPKQHGSTNQQDFVVKVVKVSGSPPVATVTNTKLFTAFNGNGSVTGATFVETDRNELPSAATENTSLLYWQETNGAPSSTTTVTIKGALVRDMANWTNAVVLDTTSPAVTAFNSPYAWANYKKQGDFSRGAFFFDTTTRTLNFLAQWVNGGVSSNIVRLPQNNLPEEQFGTYESLGLPPGGGTFTQAAITAQSARLDVYANASDSSIRHKSFTSGSWSAWDTVPSGAAYFGLAAVASTSSQRDLIAVRSDGSLYYARDLSGWSGWTNLGAPSGLTLNAVPAITTWSGGRLDVFARASDGAIWHAACSSSCTALSNWSGWESLGGYFSSGPAAVAWSAGRIDIIGAGGDTTLYHKDYDWCCGWSGWESLGGDFIGGSYAPAISSWAAGRLDLFGCGFSDLLVYHKSWDWSYGWSTWLSTNTSLTSGPIGAVSGAANQIDHVTIAADGSVWHAVNAR
jgi:hypothetical protein